MVSALLYTCLIIFYTSKCCRADENLGWGENITKLYELVSSALKNDLDHSLQTRRVFINDSQYQIHLNKLKDVNGLKLHNVLITRSGPEINSTIYINNPLEAKLPHPFMSLEEFKNTLVKQQIKDREEFIRSKKKAEHSRIWAKIKATAKSKTKPALAKQTHQLNPRKSTKSNFKATDNKSKPDMVQKHNIENNSKPNTDNIISKSTKPINKIHELPNMTDKTDKLSSEEVNISSAVKFRTKLLAIEHILPLNKKPPIDKSHDNTIYAENQTIDSNPNYSTTKLNKVDEERLSTVEELKTDEEPTSSTSKEEIGEGKVADNEDGSSSIDGKSTNIIYTTTTDKVDGEPTNAINTTETDEVDGGPTNITDTTATDEVDGEPTNITDTSATDKVDGEPVNITDTTTTDEELLTGVDENEATDDETDETPEENTTETSTTLSTPTTTRVKWSRPRVFMDEKPNNATISK